MLVSILALVTIMIVPLKLGFDWEPHSNPNLRLLEYFLDLLFFLDCIICFRTTYGELTKTGVGMNQACNDSRYTGHMRMLVTFSRRFDT